MHRRKAVEHLLQPVRQSLVGCVHVAEHGVRSAFGNLHRIEHGAERRLFAEADVRMPEIVARPELARRSEEHTSELQSLMRISYAVFCLKKKKRIQKTSTNISNTS